MTSARDAGFAQALREVVRGEVREGELLARSSTYRIGGPATVLHAANGEDVAIALRACTNDGIPWFAVGLGSNLLFPGAGFDALVIRVGKGLDALVQDGSRWTIGAGMPQPLAAKRTAAAGFGGIHKMVGVPGSVGGGVVMNAGCHGAEWRDTIHSVHVVDAGGNDHVIAAHDAGFAYRRSTLGRVVVLSAAVTLHEADVAALEAETEELYRWRRDETPFNQPCCGSVFKNPELPPEHPADGPRTSGQCIDATGLKGLRVGGAEVSMMHANYFVNTGAATSADVIQLMRTVRTRVFERWGVTLEPEVKLIAADGSVATLD